MEAEEEEEEEEEGGRNHCDEPIYQAPKRSSFQTSPDKIAALAAAKSVASEIRGKDPHTRQLTSREDPNFLDTFYKNSRLHFIGMWKARYEQILDTMESPPALPPPRAGGQRVILHVDMDCFFCSVGCLGRPELEGVPVAVTWGDSSKEHAGGEVSSANYTAREYGVRAGMFLPQALSLCPDLVTIPYEFDKYAETAEKMYRALFQVSPHVEGVSCDEAYVDVTSCGETPDELMAAVRANIFRATGCRASVGCSCNMLLARMATARAKPNGQFYVPWHDAEAFLAGMSVKTLPGVGYATVKKLDGMGVRTVEQLRAKSRATLQQLFGEKVGNGKVQMRRLSKGDDCVAESLLQECPQGEKLYNFARGVDGRMCERRKQRKSVCAQAGWAVRFETDAEVMNFCNELSSQVAQRLRDARARGRHIQVSMMRQVKGAPDSMRKGNLGHGICDTMTRGITLSHFVSQASEISRCARELVSQLRIPAMEVRGMGVQVSKLDNDQSSLGAAVTRKPPAPARVQSEYDPVVMSNWYEAHVALKSKRKAAASSGSKPQWQAAEQSSTTKCSNLEASTTNWSNLEASTTNWSNLEADERAADVSLASLRGSTGESPLELDPSDHQDSAREGKRRREERGHSGQQHQSAGDVSGGNPPMGGPTRGNSPHAHFPGLGNSPWVGLEDACYEPVRLLCEELDQCVLGTVHSDSRLDAREGVRVGGEGGEGPELGSGGEFESALEMGLRLILEQGESVRDSSIRCVLAHCYRLVVALGIAGAQERVLMVAPTDAPMVASRVAQTEARAPMFATTVVGAAIRNSGSAGSGGTEVTWGCSKGTLSKSLGEAVQRVLDKLGL